MAITIRRNGPRIEHSIHRRIHSSDQPNRHSSYRIDVNGRPVHYGLGQAVLPADGHHRRRVGIRHCVYSSQFQQAALAFRIDAGCVAGDRDLFVLRADYGGCTDVV